MSVPLHFEMTGMSSSVVIPLMLAQSDTPGATGTPATSQAPPVAGRAAGAPGAAGTAEGVPSTGNATPLPGAGPGGAAPRGPDFTFLFIIVAFFVLMIFMSSMTARKEKKKRAEMLSSIGRNDRVQTIGGIIGTVVEMRDDEIVLRVDDANNTRITFSRASVQGIVKKVSSPKGELEPAETVKA